MAKVKRSSVDLDGKVGGSYNDIPILNTVLYDVQFSDGAIKPYLANLIAENIIMQVNADGYHCKLLGGIQDHSKDKRAVEKKDRRILSKLGRRSMQQTTIVWKFRVKWKNVIVTWKSLRDFKESNPIEVDEYVTADGIQDKPVFAWWVPFILHKRDRIIAAVNSHVRKSSHKYSIEIPTSVQQADRID